ncbi:transposase [Flavobacterium sp. 38-13]|uniref:transposase n=1 Tax=Flavobacterium sp. 38-13 TaxID=1896168 RepID=UPI00339067FB
MHFKVKNGEKLSEDRPQEINTNRIEGLWANMKRGYIGTYNWWSKKHLNSYLNEFTFRYNTRKWKEDKRFFVFLQNVFERITQRDIIDKAWT